MAPLESPKTITDDSSALFFLDPVGRTKEIAEKLDENAPDLVIGIDFLFWFGYGNKTADARKAELKEAFEFLEELECPVLVGDLPAFEKSFVLSEEQIPSDKELAVLNGMIAEFAKKHEHVSVYALAALLESIRAGDAVTINGRERTLKLSEVFTVDRLHVTKAGLVAVTAMVLESLAQEGGPLADTELTLGPDELTEELPAEEAAAPVGE